MAQIRVKSTISELIKDVKRRFSTGNAKVKSNTIPILCNNCNTVVAYDSINNSGINYPKNNSVAVSVTPPQRSNANDEHNDERSKTETPYEALGQLLIPFLIAGLGNVAAGIVLDLVQNWTVFKSIPHLIILIPALLGLKGNVEMTLASRLSTHANLGHMDDAVSMRSMIISNMALVQCQASTVGLIAPLTAILLSSITDTTKIMGIRFDEVILMTASSVITANICNLLLGSLMCVVVTMSRKYHVNPDNIATPIAASFGDFTTMLILALTSQFLFTSSITTPWLSYALLLFFTFLTPLWVYIARKNEHTKPVLVNGWVPILGAMMLQNTGGLIMENALTRFQRIAAFQPIINGVGGNLVAIQSSRISTYLHRVTQLGSLPENSDPLHLLIIPCKTFFGKNPHALMARLLLLIVGPSHLLFLIFLRIVKGHFIFTLPFLTCYIIASLFQVTMLLYLCYCMVHWMWCKKFDPDNCSIPFLTALADLFGSILLFLSFLILFKLNDPNAFNDDASTIVSLIDD